MGLSLRYFYGDDTSDNEVWSRSITHNLAPMAQVAGLYQVLWRPDELGITRAGEMVPKLAVGLVALAGDPELYRAMEPENGWGTYKGLCVFAGEAIGNAAAYPDARVYACR